MRAVIKDLLLRCPPSSDLACWKQVIQDEQYRCVVEAYKDARTIVDLGANIGLASRYFSFHYPQARIISVEPDESNFSVLELNSNDSMELVHAGIWSKTCRLSTNREFRDRNDWAVRTAESHEGIRGITLPELMDEREIKQIDILKVDVEGAEFELFKDARFLKDVGIVAMEIHKELGNQMELLDTLTTNGFDFAWFGETLLATR